eukprot:TRINITY_DN66444_c11_g5_i1.p1 TRINITY_DN66444_c11_g5~~TRINITY_DN66444_c11_g5_i1.p1  ORF type:complete len:248 (+),score=29.84 TRINITY_DN66444_c11_g5_i1:26-745(+)
MATNVPSSELRQELLRRVRCRVESLTQQRLLQQPQQLPADLDLSHMDEVNSWFNKHTTRGAKESSALKKWITNSKEVSLSVDHLDQPCPPWILAGTSLNKQEAKTVERQLYTLSGLFANVSNGNLVPTVSGASMYAGWRLEDVATMLYRLRDAAIDPNANVEPASDLWDWLEQEQHLFIFCMVAPTTNNPQTLEEVVRQMEDNLPGEYINLKPLCQASWWAQDEVGGDIPSATHQVPHN